MFKITVVNKRTHKPTANDVYIGRPSVLGNPFTHIADKRTLAQYVVGSREQAVQMYREYFLKQIKENKAFRTAFVDLIGKCQYHDVNLVCWCAPQSCHGDILKEQILAWLNPKID